MACPLGPVSETRTQTQVQQNGPHHCSWSLLWTHLIILKMGNCVHLAREFPESWFECRGCGKMEAWEPGMEEGPAGGRYLRGSEEHTRWASKFGQGFFLTVYPLVCLPLCLLLPDDFALWDFGPWPFSGKGQSTNQHLRLLCVRHRTKVCSYSSAK